MMRTSMLTLLILALVAGAAGAGSLEPSAPPGPTMKTLDEIPPTWSLVLPAAARFQIITGMNSGAVLDKETGLVWLRSTVGFSSSYGAAVGVCLSYSSARGGWRLPTTAEMTSLWDGSASSAPFLPPGHPFLGLQADSVYWTADTVYDSANPGKIARTVSFDNQFAPDVSAAFKEASTLTFWCVRGSGGGSVNE
jgi:uncharacterized protein DUF1566